jgi:glycerol kinase
VSAAPTWQSTGTRDLCEGLSGHAGMVRRLTGLPLSPHYSATKVARLLDSHRGLRRRAERGELLFGNVATFLVWHFTGGSVHATDPTQAARTQLFNIGSLDWDDRLLGLFHVPRALLPEVRDSIGDFGTMKIDGRKIPIKAMLGDQQAALVGAMGFIAGDAGSGANSSRRPMALVNYGTGSFVLVPTFATAVRRTGLLTSLAWTRSRRRCYLLEGTVNASSSLLDWLSRELGVPGDLRAIERLCRKSPGSASIFPVFRGLGSMHLAPGATGMQGFLWNMPEEGLVADITRACVESTAHLVSEILEQASDATGGRPGGVVVSGGLSRLKYLVEFQSALLGRPVLMARSGNAEATLLGVAQAASPEPEAARPRRWREVSAPASMRTTAVARNRRWRSLLRWAARASVGRG